MKKIYLSHTAIDTYDKCSWKHFLKYGLKIQPMHDIRWPLVAGVALHELAEAMYKHKDYSKKFLLKNWPSFFEMAVENEVSNWQEPKDKDKQLSYGYGLVSNFYTLAKAKDYLRDPIEAEWGFTINLATTVIRGKVDLIIKTKKYNDILDWKTGWGTPSKKDVDNNLQLTIYDWAVKTKLGLKNTRTGLVYPRKNIVIYSKRTSIHHDKFVDKAEDIANKIRNGEFSPNFNHCNWCELKHACKHYIQKEKDELSLK